MVAFHGGSAGRVPLHRQVVEQAVGAEHVELLRQVRTLTVRARSFPLAGRKVVRAMGTRPERHPALRSHSTHLLSARRYRRPPLERGAERPLNRGTTGPFASTPLLRGWLQCERRRRWTRNPSSRSCCSPGPTTS